MGIPREKWRSGGGFFHPGPSHWVPAGKALRPRDAGRGLKWYSVRPIVSESGSNPPPQSREESQTLYDTAFAMCAGLGLIGLLAAAALAPLLWI